MIKKHSITTRLLHWLTALMVLALFFSGWYMVELDYYSPWYNSLPEWHFLLGCILLILWLMMLLRLFRKHHDFTAPHSRTERVLSGLVKIMFYVMVTFMVVTGYLMLTANGEAYLLWGVIKLPAVSLFSPEQIDILGNSHQYVSYFLMILVVLHVLGALKHHFIDRDPTLKRML